MAAIAVGEAAPALAAPEIGGGRFDLGGESGKVVIVNFWATWCQPCREEMPTLAAFYKRFQTEGVDIIGISVDRARDRDAVENAAKTVPYPVALYSELEASGFKKPAALPVTYIIDRGGVIRAILSPEVDAITDAALERVVVPLLKN